MAENTKEIVKKQIDKEAVEVQAKRFYDPNMEYVKYELKHIDKHGKPLTKTVCHRKEIYEIHKKRNMTGKVFSQNIPASEVKDAAIKNREIQIKGK